MIVSIRYVLATRNKCLNSNRKSSNDNYMRSNDKRCQTNKRLTGISDTYINYN